MSGFTNRGTNEGYKFIQMDIKKKRYKVKYIAPQMVQMKRMNSKVSVWLQIGVKNDTHDHHKVKPPD